MMEGIERRKRKV